MKRNHRTLVSLICAASMILSTALPNATVYAEDLDMAAKQESQELEAAPEEGTTSSETTSSAATESQMQETGTADSETASEETSKLETFSEISSDDITASEETASSESAAESTADDAASAAETAGTESAETTSEETTVESTDTSETDSSIKETTEETTEASTEETTEETTEASTEETTEDISDLPTKDELEEQIRRKEDEIEVEDDTVTLTGEAKCDGNVIAGYASFELSTGDLHDMAPSIDGYEFTGDIQLNGVGTSKIYEEEVDTTKTQTFEIREEDAKDPTTVTEDVIVGKKLVTKAETANGDVTITEDGTVTFSYYKKYAAVDIHAAYVDEDGNPISDSWSDVDLSFDSDTMVLEDTFPAKLTVAKDDSEKKVSEYTYEKTYIRDGEGKAAVTDLRRTGDEGSYQYQILKDGDSDYTDLTSDTTLYVEYKAEGQKSVYTYSDVNVTVTATLQQADAIPDDAKFVVTQITPSAEGYNYDAYMDALNNAGEDTQYDSGNTLLYDIAFLGYAVDGNGNVDTSKTVEYQPAAGSVQINVQFHKNQLSDALGAEADSDITVTHLPLKDEVRASSSTTKDATNISADSIDVKPVSAKVSVSEETTAFETDNFSAFAFQNSENKMVLSASRDGVNAKDALGDAWYYGITANTWNFDGESETNFAVFNLLTNGGQTGITEKAAGSESASSIVANLNHSLTIKGKPEVVTCTSAASDLLTHESGAGNLKFNITSADVIRSTIDGMLSHVADESSTLATRKSVSDYSVHGTANVGSQDVFLDFSSAGSGTIYVNPDLLVFDQKQNGETQGTFTMSQALEASGKVTIYKRTDQVIVFNFPGKATRTINKYFFAGSPDSTTGAVSTSSINGQSTRINDSYEGIIFNFPEAEQVDLYDTGGIFLAPKAHVFTGNGNCGGWVAANEISTSSEWHFTNGNLPDVFHGTTAKLEAIKTIDGKEATVSGFNFNLYQKQNDGTWNQIASTTNSGSSVDFGTLNYNDNSDGSFTDQTKTYYYKITEQSGNNGTVTISANGTNTVYTTDPTVYYAKIVIRGTCETKNNQNVYGVEVVSKEYYDNEACTGTPLSTVPTFNNTTRQTKTTTASISAVKNLTGRALKDDEFSFTLTAEDNAPMPEGAKDGKLTVTNKGTAVDFGSITYDKAGTYHYTITEDAGNVSGVTYDTSTKDVTVTVTDDGKGNLNASVAGDGEAATFRNTYKAGATSASISAVKNLMGRALKDGEFSFTLTAKDNAPMPEGAKDGKLTVTNDGTAVNFGSIKYDKAGTYHYTITEDAGNISGVTYDDSTKNVTVTVTDDGKGNLNASVAGDGEAATFRNTYKAGTTSAAISAVKSLSGRALKDGEFSFTLTAKDNAPMPEGAKDGKVSVTNKGTAVDFGSITYDRAGTYSYTITEDAGSVSGVTYDTSTKNVTVTVTDNGDGTLSAVVAGGGKDATFNNTYKTGTTSASISAVKSLTGRALKDGEFSFTLTASDNAPMPEGAKDGRLIVTNNGTAVDFGSITYDKAGTYSYTITEVNGKLGGVTYDTSTKDVTVTVTDDGKGNLNASVAGDGEAATFRNTYKAGTTSAAISAVKSLTGRALKDGEFSFTLTAKDNAPMPEGAKDGKLTVTNKGTAVNFGSITYEKAGTYHYTITEDAGSVSGVTYDTSTKDVTVTATDNGDGTLSAVVAGDGEDATFKNTYKTGTTTASISAVKSLSGRALKDGEFSFTLTAKDSAPMPEGAKDGKLTVTNKGTAVNFGSITYDKAGTYSYTITEVNGKLGGVTYDDSTKDVTVTVTDDGKGNLNASVAGDGKAATFNNTYKTGTTTASISAIKNLTGRALKDGEFSFTLTARDNAPMPEGAKDGKFTVTNKGKAVNFGSITYDKAGTYHYTITEDAGSVSGVTYDTSTKDVTVTVTDDGKGNLNASVAGDGEAATFRNTYKAGTTSAAISAVKSLSGRALKDGEFSFTLTAKNNAPMPEGAKDGKLNVTNDGSAVNFGSITYDKAGTYRYTITEDAGNAGGVTYDTSTKDVTVEVTDDGSGNLSAAVSGTGSDATFTNVYSAAGSVTFHGTKTLANAAAGKITPEGYFFTITDEDGNVLTAMSGKDGTIGYPAIHYDLSDLGIHTYTVSEKHAGETIEGVTYSTQTYTVTVKVADNGDGTLNVQASDDADALNFTNTYGAKTSITFAGTKTLKNDNPDNGLTPAGYSFTITGDDGTAYTAGSNADGTIDYPVISYTQADVGRHTYTVSETKGSQPGISYDTRTYTVVVDVTGDGKGNLTATAQGGADALNFTNTYTTTNATAVITGRKVLKNRDLAKGEFGFELKSEDGTLIQSVTNDVNGGITFAPISYTVSDAGKTFTYTVDEVKGSEDRITYDSTVYTVTVTVTDNGDGTLSAAVSEDPKIVFTNTYTPEVPHTPETPTPNTPNTPETPNTPNTPETPSAPSDTFEDEESGDVVEAPFDEESGDQAEGQEEVEGDEEDDNTASPKTGDDSRLPLYLILILVSVMTITGCGLYRRKKRSEDNQ